MSFSINYNAASAQAQNYLKTNSDFQAKTINRVTSGLRIVSSGDDAAGLAVANGLRSDQAVLSQGIRNGNDGISTLQTIDSGMNNISTLLDRARTLATQSASGTFTGDRKLLQGEFSSVLGEIDRQSTAIGLNTGGQFAKNLSVFIGGGKGSDPIGNGQVSLNLGQATVDTSSLGLKGFSTATAGDIGPASTSKVSTIVGANTATSFNISGPNFTNTSVNVNLNGVTDGATLVNAINAGIASAASTDTNVKAANLQASIVTTSDGKQQLAFSSSTAAFSVAAGDAVANQFLKGDATAIAPVTADTLVAGGTQQTASLSLATPAASDKQTISFTALDSDGAPQTTKLQLSYSGTDTAATVAASINSQLQGTNNKALTGIVALADASGGVTFSSASGSQFTVSVGDNTTAAKGLNGGTGTILTSSQAAGGATADISTEAGATAAVSALANAVSKLGTAQAQVGKGQNNLNYAISLAQSQQTNAAAAESRIRDADLASEAANLTKAQILMQAGTAALAQANSAPQAVLSLLRG